MAGLGRLKATLGMGADDLQQTSAPVSTHRNQHQLIGSDSSTLNPFPLGNWRYSPSWLLPQLEVFSPHPRAAGKSAEQLSQKGNLHPPPRCEHAVLSLLCTQAGRPWDAVSFCAWVWHEHSQPWAQGDFFALWGWTCLSNCSRCLEEE